MHWIDVLNSSDLLTGTFITVIILAVAGFTYAIVKYMSKL